MINPQLLDFIKQQLLKGVEKETITKELLGGGWAEVDIDEGFSLVNNNQLQVPQKVPFLPEDKLINTTEQSKLKNNLLKKKISFKIILYIILVIWILLEILNFVNYIKQKNTYQKILEQYREERLINPQTPSPIILTMGGVKYRPVVWVIVYLPLEILGITSVPVYKPIIYLYPTQVENVKVELEYKGTLIADYPKYDYLIKGWNVTAYPDGKIINGDGKEYSYIFWEGIPNKPANYDLSTGFIIKGEDTVVFLQDTLSKMGLTPKEYNEFIVYWYPKMKDNKYNLVHFAGEEYTDTAPLIVTPKPDSMLRVFMVFKPLDRIIEVNPQEIKSFNRTGFTVIEWGGTELRK